MKPANCLIIDGIEPDRLAIEEHIRQYSNLRLIGSFSKPSQADRIFQTHDVQLLFMDIDMPVSDGINFLKKLDRPPLCIFITASADYAIRAFDVHAFDYILKPIKWERLTHTLQRINQLLELREKAWQYGMRVEDELLTIKEGNTINRVAVNDILYLEALTNYTRVVTPTNRYITLKNLKNFLEELPEGRFLRVHRSYAVARNKIRKLQNSALSLGEFSIPLGKTYRQAISRILCEKPAPQIVHI